MHNKQSPHLGDVQPDFPCAPHEEGQRQRRHLLKYHVVVSKRSSPIIISRTLHSKRIETSPSLLFPPPPQIDALASVSHSALATDSDGWTGEGGKEERRGRARFHSGGIGTGTRRRRAAANEAEEAGTAENACALFAKTEEGEGGAMMVGKAGEAKVRAAAEARDADVAANEKTMTAAAMLDLGYPETKD